ncbi:MAG: flagellar capping protein, partial [Clostridia bacterium]|nr:flagellar capping protein [Clostridia bacterium]
VKQDKQMLEWKRDDYRSMTRLLKELNDTYMDVLSPSNMRSSNSYKAFTVGSSDSTAVTATANADAVAGTHSITVTQLAKAANTISSSGVSSPLQSTAAITNVDFTGGKDFNVQLNGITKNITVSGSFTDVDQLKAYIQTEVDKAFGSGKIAVGNSSGQLTFSAADSKINLISGTTDALAQLNITSGSTNRLNLSAKLDATNMPISNSGIVSFKINGVSFEFDSATKTMNDVISEVNSSAAGVTLSYSEATDKFTLTSKVKGAGDAIKIEEISGDFFGANSKLGITSLTISNGQDAIFELDNTTITRNDNSFLLDGVKYNLLKEGVTTSITLEQDVDKVYNNIKSFVDKYNEMISKINGELREERDSDYTPLTDEQREAMSESEIEKWEEKAKSGMLRNDSLLSGMLVQMRNAIYKSIEGVNGGVYSIGIKTGDYTQQGKLIIDEVKLKDAIKNKPDLVANIFNKESEINYSPNLDATDKTTRYNESGIVHRLYDIIQSNITTIPNTAGQKGLLIEKAGFTGDYIDISSYISSQIRSKDQLIDTLTDKLFDKEEQYYQKFAALEKAMSQMSSQSSWIAQQFGSGQ